MQRVRSIMFCFLTHDRFGAAGCSVESLKQLEWSMKQVLGQDTSAISTLRCLKTYFERLGYGYLEPQTMSGLPTLLVVESLFDVSFLNCRPSVIAAAILYAERRQRGVVPFWPSVLSKMTGYEDLATPELTLAVRSALKMCRKVLYVHRYRAHITSPYSQDAQASLSISLPVVTGAPLDVEHTPLDSVEVDLPIETHAKCVPVESCSGSVGAEEPVWLLGLRALRLDDG